MLDERIEVTEEEVFARFREVLNRKRPNGKPISQREMADELRVDQSTITRNARRFGRNIASYSANPVASKGDVDFPLGDKMHDSIEKVLKKGKLAELRRRRLQEQKEASAADDARREANRKQQQANLDIQRKADEKRDHQARLAREADVTRCDGVIAALELIYERFRADGRLPATGVYYGDDGDLIETADPEDIRYAADGTAAVALLPEEHLFPCGWTAAELRAGVPATLRLQPMAVPKGTPRPEYIGKRDAYFVPRVLYPDSPHFFSEDYADIMACRRMNKACRALVLDPLPVAIAPEVAESFKAFVTFDQQLRERGFRFEASCLDGCDVERRLREINERTILPIAGAAAMVGLKRTLKWTGVAALILTVIGIAVTDAYLLVREAVELFQQLKDFAAPHATTAVGWLDEAKPILGGGAAAVAALALVWWWLKPRRTDRDGAFASRFIIVAGGLVLAVGGVVWLFGAVALFERNSGLVAALVQSFS